MHLTPAGFPLGIPGIGEDIDGAIQHAPQPVIQNCSVFFNIYLFYPMVEINLGSKNNEPINAISMAIPDKTPKYILG